MCTSCSLSVCSSCAVVATYNLCFCYLAQMLMWSQTPSFLVLTLAYSHLLVVSAEVFTAILLQVCKCILKHIHVYCHAQAAGHTHTLTATTHHAWLAQAMETAASEPFWLQCFCKCVAVDPPWAHAWQLA